MSRAVPDLEAALTPKVAVRRRRLQREPGGENIIHISQLLITALCDAQNAGFFGRQRVSRPLPANNRDGPQHEDDGSRMLTSWPFRYGRQRDRSRRTGAVQTRRR